MIPILYETNEQTFTSNGLGRLSDCLSCVVTEERNGRYDMEFTYPVNGVHFDDITEGRIVAVTHDESGDVQPFVIYASSKPIDGVVTFNAYHLSYRLGKYISAYHETASEPCGYILFQLAEEAKVPNSEPWAYYTDITATTPSFHPYTVGDIIDVYTIRECLGGTEGSVLDIFGGEYEWDKWTIKLHQARGANNGVSIRYGKNLTDFKAETDYSGAYSHVYGYYKGDYMNSAIRTQGTLTTVYDTGHRLPGNRIAYIGIDFTDKIENGDTKQSTAIVSELTTLATSYATTNKIWEPSVSIDVDFVQLWQTEEFADYAPLLTCHLCDTVNVTFGMYGLRDMAVKIVAVEWDVLNERYKKMTLGGLATTLETAITSNVTGAIQAQADAIATLNSKTDIEVLTLTRTNNSYVDATSFARMAAIRCGKIGFLFANIQMSTSMPTGTTEFEVGVISGVTLANASIVTVPCQSNNATIMVDVTTAGKILLSNFSGTATGTNYCRAIIPLRFA